MIRHFVLASASVIALTATASAADMYRAPEGVGSFKDEFVPGPTWAGFYAGINGGLGWDADARNIALSNNAGTTLTTPGANAQGTFAGGQIGYNLQRGAFVYGVEADVQGSAMQDSFSNRYIGASAFLNAEKNLDWFGTVRGRLGYAFNNILVYGTGGVAFGGVHNRLVVFEPGVASADLDKDSTEAGFAVGGGVEYAATPRWSLKAEYQFIDLGSYKLSAESVPPGTLVSASSIDNSFNTLRVGLNYHVGASFEPLK